VVVGSLRSIIFSVYDGPLNDELYFIEVAGEGDLVMTSDADV
jgi:hypothetical protein